MLILNLKKRLRRDPIACAKNQIEYYPNLLRCDIDPYNNSWPYKRSVPQMMNGEIINLYKDFAMPEFKLLAGSVNDPKNRVGGRAGIYCLNGLGCDCVPFFNGIRTLTKAVRKYDIEDEGLELDLKCCRHRKKPSRRGGSQSLQTVYKRRNHPLFRPHARGRGGGINGGTLKGVALISSKK